MKHIIKSCVVEQYNGSINIYIARLKRVLSKIYLPLTRLETKERT